jgi:hypothetical protein
VAGAAAGGARVQAMCGMCGSRGAASHAQALHLITAGVRLVMAGW